MRTREVRVFGSAAAGALLLLLQGCASTKPEPGEIKQAQLAIQDAKDAGAEAEAGPKYQAASNHLSQARREWNSGHEAASLHYAQIADSEARDAEFQAKNAKAQQALDNQQARKARLEAQLRDLRGTQERMAAAKAESEMAAAARAREEQARIQAEMAAREAERRAAEESQRNLQAQLDAERLKAADQQRRAEIDRLVGQLEEQKKAAEAAQQAAAQERAQLEEARRQEEERRKAAEQQTQLQADLVTRLQQIEKSTKVDARGIVVTLPGNVYFASGRAELQPGIKAHLAQIGKALAGVPDRKILIEGHTDSTGTLALNMKLSELRAESVRAVFVEQGVAADRIETHGFGPTKPVENNQTASGRSQNRRVEIVVEGQAPH